MADQTTKSMVEMEAKFSKENTPKSFVREEVKNVQKWANDAFLNKKSFTQLKFETENRLDPLEKFQRLTQQKVQMADSSIGKLEHKI